MSNPISLDPNFVCWSAKDRRVSQQDYELNVISAPPPSVDYKKHASAWLERNKQRFASPIDQTMFLGEVAEAMQGKNLFALGGTCDRIAQTMSPLIVIPKSEPVVDSSSAAITETIVTPPSSKQVEPSTPSEKVVSSEEKLHTEVCSKLNLNLQVVKDFQKSSIFFSRALIEAFCDHYKVPRNPQFKDGLQRLLESALTNPKMTSSQKAEKVRSNFVALFGTI